MTEIRIDNTGNGTWYLYNGNEGWKDYICEDFDEQVVLTGNRDFKDYTEASWYQEAKDVLTDIDCYDEYPDDLNDEIKAKLKELYDECRCTEDILIDVIRLLNPNDTFKSGTIRGYCQGDWQEYIVKENVDVEQLENFYFGKIADITVSNDEEEFGDVITHDELWEAEREDLKEYMRKRYELSENEEVYILKADGMKQVVDWKEVC